MRPTSSRLVGIALLAGLMCLPAAEVLADSYVWGGRLGRVAVNVEILGFHEGAGVGGWTLDGARRFATWARRIDAVLPPETTVDIFEQLETDEPLVIEIHSSGRGQRVETTIREFVSSDQMEEVVSLLAAHFRTTVPPAASHVDLYTIQLFASRRYGRAQRFADRAESRDLLLENEFFYEACRPCRIPETRVLGPTGDDIYRVIIGVFPDRADARRSLAKLRARGYSTGFVRAL